MKERKRTSAPDKKQIPRRPTLAGLLGMTEWGDGLGMKRRHSSGAERQAGSEQFFHGLIGAAVFRAGTVAGQGVQMFSRAIAFVSSKAILWVFPVKTVQMFVQSDLCQDRSSCNQK